MNNIIELNGIKYQKVETNEGHKGCGILFKSGSGIIICGEKRVDGNQFFCKRCLKETPKIKRNLKKFNLSEKIGEWQAPNIYLEDIKEFIKLIKENTHFESHNDQDEWEDMINKLIGDKLG
jgi:hypothetical protein